MPSAAEPTCAQCGTDLSPKQVGRPARFCSATCRKAFSRKATRRRKAREKIPRLEKRLLQKVEEMHHTSTFLFAPREVLQTDEVTAFRLAYPEEVREMLLRLTSGRSPDLIAFAKAGQQDIISEVAERIAVLATEIAKLAQDHQHNSTQVETATTIPAGSKKAVRPLKGQRLQQHPSRRARRRP